MFVICHVASVIEANAGRYHGCPRNPGRSTPERQARAGKEHIPAWK
jgi:hypothetical protein